MNEVSPFGRTPLQHLSMARLMQFGDHLRVDHAALDAQHRAIFELGVKVYEDWRRGASLDVLRPALGTLSDLLNAHFKLEERVLQEIGYEGLERHAAEHRELRDELSAVCARLHAVSDGAQVPQGPDAAAVQFILGLTVGHVAGSDMQYCRAIEASGIAKAPGSTRSLQPSTQRAAE